MKDDFDSWLAERRLEDPADIGGLLRGTEVGEYRIVALLGRGGFAEVYRADDADGQTVAIKMLHRLDDKSRARFEREAKILTRIRHPNIPRLLGFGSCGNRPYMVMEFLSAYELPHKDREVARFLTRVIAAASELHRQGYVHRDIKPPNILKRENGEPVLTDFGLACPLSRAKREEERLSTEGEMKVAVGTVGYSAPEQFSGQTAGRRADVHAIGALINDCFDGRMSGCWRKIYLTATNSNPRTRYPTVETLGKAIRWRHARYLWWGLGTAVVLTVIGILVVRSVNDYVVENNMPHKFQERGL